jgi:uncharacterized protein (TIGR03435 family)
MRGMILRLLRFFPTLSCLAAVPLLPAQFDAFEVAAIKPAGPQDERASRYIRMQSAHVFQAKNYTLHGMIAAAYDLNPRAISGGPGWVDSQPWEILARTPGDKRPTWDDQMAMLRKLLADRFNLSFHREKKQFNIYDLTVSKEGPKLKATEAAPDEAPNMTSVVYPATSGGIDHIGLPAHNITITQFAGLLNRAILDRPVVDHTGLSGRYDFDLEWTPDETEFGGQLPPGPPDTPRPGLFLAMQEKLGLKIEATRGAVDAIVIDRLERPTDN